MKLKERQKEEGREGKDLQNKNDGEKKEMTERKAD